MVRRRWKDLVPSAVQTQSPKTKVSRVVEGDGRLDVDGNRQIRHVI
jgi:hypothetical protein